MTAEPIADQTAEQSVLGAILLTQKTLDDVRDILDPGDFYRPANATIYETMLDLAGKGEPVDDTTVLTALNTGGELARVGGRTYLHDLLAQVRTAANATYYAKIVAETAVRRRLSDAGVRIAQLASTPDGISTDDLVEVARAEVDATSKATADVTTLADVMDDYLEALERGETARIVAPTPWDELTHLLGGWRRGALYVVGARPGVGKTIVALQAALGLADAGTVAFNTLEMSTQEIWARAVANKAEVALGRLNGTGEPPSPRCWDLIAKARAALNVDTLAIDDRSMVGPSQIRSHARSVARRGQLSAIVVDYLQLMQAPSNMRRGASQYEIVTALSRQMKLLAGELDVPVILLTQLNRNSATDNRAPSMHDIRDSGAIEQDSDVILLLHHGNPNSPDIDLLVAKNRHGVAGSVIPLERRGEYSKLVPRRWKASNPLNQ